MALILNIHTATETALINLVKDGGVFGTLANGETKEHASFLHVAIKELLLSHNIPLKDLDAIGVTSGPGSFTGIRVGLATAKGLCYALKTPLITYNSLELMAIAATDFAQDADALYCPMLDARRMEVYTALYNYDLEEIIPPSAIVLSEAFLPGIPFDTKILFSGSGSTKFEKISKHTNGIFLSQEITTESLAKIAMKKYKKNEFENVTYAKPLYIK